MTEVDKSRRDFVQKVAYTVPVIASLHVMPAFAKQGSQHCDNGLNGTDCNPPGIVRNPQNQNDIIGTPSNPSNNPN